MVDGQELRKRLEARIAELPPGYISKKTIKGKTQYYLQWNDGEKLRSSILTFLLAANLPSKIGRKNTVLIGIAALAIGFVIILLYFFFNGVFNEEYHQLIEKNNNQLPFSVIPIYICIALCGAGWALINANSYPMMVEMSSRNNIGKYTGYYYTISMVAQTITPILVGIIMYKSESSLKLLYIYSAILMILAFLSMLFFKEKKHQKILSKKGLDALDVD